MKLTFNIGMQFIFGYTEKVNLVGPVYPWQVASEYNEYLEYLHDVDLMMWGDNFRAHNMHLFIILTNLKKL